MTEIEIKTYEDLEAWIKKFMEGKIDILILLSNAGLGKTEMVDYMMKNMDYGYVNAHTTPLSLFEIGYKFRNKPIVIDDIDTVLDNNDLVSLFKQFAETRDIKHIEWKSTSVILEKLEVPQEYDTTSKILLIGNKVRKVASLIDRGFCVVFKPTKQEILNKIESIAKDMKIEKKKSSEILEFLRTMNGEITLRTFKKVLNLYGGKGRWNQWLAHSMKVSNKTIICELIVRNLPREKWIEAWKFFAQKSGNEWSRTNFYYHFRQLNLEDVKEIEFDIEKTLAEFQRSVSVKQANLRIGHPVKMQNLLDISQNKRVQVSTDFTKMEMRDKNADKK